MLELLWVHASMPKNANVRKKGRGMERERGITRKVLDLAYAQSSDQQEVYKIHDRY